MVTVKKLLYIVITILGKKAQTYVFPNYILSYHKLHMMSTSSTHFLGSVLK
jgi:hypothetical protein